jgi:CRISPR-associated endonuclease Cas1
VKLVRAPSPVAEPNIQPALRAAEPLPAGLALEEDDLGWAERSSFWANRATQARARGSKRERPRQPLVLTGHNASLRVEGGSLLIRNGFTHYPQKQETYRFFKGELMMPKRIIMLDGSGSISFDVLSWLAEQDVALIRLDWRGGVVCVMSRTGYAANPYRVLWQRETRADEKRRMEFSTALITRKIENSILTLEKSVRKTDAWNRAMESAYSTLTRLDQRQPKTISELRVLEAGAAAAYFRAWKGTPIRWRNTRKRPIPEKWREIGQRKSIFHTTGNRNAAHPVNAMLNYAYTVLQSEIQMSAISEGYDPTIGIMHEEHRDSAAFVFDLMEQSRPEVDRNLLRMLNSQSFHSADFSICRNGICRLAPQMARYIAGLCPSSIPVVVKAVP